MSIIFKVSTMAALLVLVVGLGTSDVKANPVTVSTTGVFSVSGTNVVNFTNINGTTTITFNGTTDSVNTPAATSFGDLVVTTTVPANQTGPAIGGTFTLNVFHVSPAGGCSFLGTLAEDVGFNSVIATLTFTGTSM